MLLWLATGVSDRSPRPDGTVVGEEDDCGRSFTRRLDDRRRPLPSTVMSSSLLFASFFSLFLTASSAPYDVTELFMSVAGSVARGVARVFGFVRSNRAVALGRG